MREYDSPEAIAERQRRAAHREEARQRWAARREEARQCWVEKHGFHDHDQPLAKALRAGRVDPEVAELLAFRARYRHEFTDYEERYEKLNWQELKSVHGFEEARAIAREHALNYTEEPIPEKWPEYLERYGFTSPEAAALAGVLADPSKAHPVWFKRSEIAVRGMKLDDLTYDTVRQAIVRRFGGRDRDEG